MAGVRVKKAKANHKTVKYRWADLRDQTTRNLIAESRAKRKAERLAGVA